MRTAGSDRTISLTRARSLLEYLCTTSVRPVWISGQYAGAADLRQFHGYPTHSTVCLQRSAPGTRCRPDIRRARRNIRYDGLHAGVSVRAAGLAPDAVGGRRGRMRTDRLETDGAMRPPALAGLPDSVATSDAPVVARGRGDHRLVACAAPKARRRPGRRRRAGSRARGRRKHCQARVRPRLRSCNAGRRSLSAAAWDPPSASHRHPSPSAAP